MNNSFALSRPSIALAPMAGVTDLPFRIHCEKIGADYSVTEMAATAPQLLDSNKNSSRLHFTPLGTENILQIIGNDPLQMAKAVEYYTNHSDESIDIIDINLGCPAKKVSRKGAGSALLSELPLVNNIITAVRSASPVPVTLKTRLGVDHDTYTLLPLAEIALKAGVNQITVHGRTRACRFSGTAQFEEIALLKQTFPQLRVIANGDIDSVAAAQRVHKQTRCDGLMIGRAAVGNPWLLHDIRSCFDDTFSYTTHSKNKLIQDHIRDMHTFYEDGKGVRFARKHIQAYFVHLGITEFFRQIAPVTDATEQLSLLAHILTEHSPLHHS